MQTVLVTILAVAVLMTMMAIGVMLTGKVLRGSCGGATGSCGCGPAKRAKCEAEGKGAFASHSHHEHNETGGPASPPPRRLPVIDPRDAQ